MVVGVNLPDQSAVRRGTSISRPSTFTLIFSIAGGAGFVSVVDAADILFNAKAQRRRDAKQNSLCAFALKTKYAHLNVAGWRPVSFPNPAQRLLIPSPDALHPPRLSQ